MSALFSLDIINIADLMVGRWYEALKIWSGDLIHTKGLCDSAMMD